MFTEKELMIKSLQGRSDRLRRFGMTDATLIMGMAIKFIDRDETLRRLLLTCRDFNDCLK